MKADVRRYLALLGLLGFAILFSCNQNEDVVNADLESVFILIGESKVAGKPISEIKDKETGCHYYFYSKLQFGSALTPRIRADGTPYCS